LPETVTARVTARLLERWECLSDKFREPLAGSLSLDHDWVWVAVADDRIIGFLAACACHGVALVVRIRMDENAPVSALIVLLRRFFRDARNRGLKGFIVFLDSKEPIEQRISFVMRRAFGGQSAMQHSLIISAGFPMEE
jgi:hypothetical protein